MFIAMCGAVCGIQAIATNQTFIIVCALTFLPSWVGLVIVFFKRKTPEAIARLILNKNSK